MAMKEKKPEPAQNPEPSLPVEEIRRGLDAIDSQPLTSRPARELIMLARDLERAGIVTINRGPAINVQPTITTPIDGIDRYLAEMDKIEQLGKRVYKPNGFDSFADSKLGGELGSAMGSIAAEFAKSKIHSGDLDREMKLEAIKLERAKVERGFVPVAPPGSQPPQQQQHVHTQPQQPAPVLQKLSPETEALLRQHDERNARIEEMLRRLPNPEPSTPAKSEPPAASSAPILGTALISIRCGVCKMIVQVRAGDSAELADRFGVIHSKAQHPEENKRWNARANEILDAMQSADEQGRARMTGPVARRELAKIAEEAFAIIPDQAPATPSAGAGPDPSPARKEAPKNGRKVRSSKGSAKSD